jgi:hypothetical protein
MAFGFPLTVGPRDKKGACRVGRSFYTSTEQPGRFQYAVTNRAVALIDERARFVALQAGVTGIITTTGGVMDTMHVIVGPALPAQQRLPQQRSLP